MPPFAVVLCLLAVVGEADVSAVLIRQRKGNRRTQRDSLQNSRRTKKEQQQAKHKVWSLDGPTGDKNTTSAYDWNKIVHKRYGQYRDHLKDESRTECDGFITNSTLSLDNTVPPYNRPCTTTNNTVGWMLSGCFFWRRKKSCGKKKKKKKQKAKMKSSQEKTPAKKQQTKKHSFRSRTSATYRGGADRHHIPPTQISPITMPKATAKKQNRHPDTRQPVGRARHTKKKKKTHLDRGGGGGLFQTL